MKKVLLTAGLLALATVAGAKSFDGIYVGAKASYMPSFMNSDANYSFANSTAGQDVDLNYWEGDLLLGQWFQTGDWNWAVEGNVGRGITGSESTKTITGTTTKIKTSRGFKIGAAGRLGQTVGNDILVYGRLGFQGSQFQSKLSYTGATTGSKSMNFFSWAIAPGAGVEWAFADNMTARFEYIYEYSLNKTSTKAANTTVSLKNPQINILSLGVSYAL
jgi:outer membrane immunogenic protein